MTYKSQDPWWQLKRKIKSEKTELGEWLAVSSGPFMQSLKVRVHGRGEYSRAGMRNRRLRNWVQTAWNMCLAWRLHSNGRGTGGFAMEGCGGCRARMQVACRLLQSRRRRVRKHFSVREGVFALHLAPAAAKGLVRERRGRYDRLHGHACCDHPGCWAGLQRVAPLRRHRTDPTHSRHTALRTHAAHPRTPPTLWNMRARPRQAPCDDAVQEVVAVALLLC